MQNLSWSHPFFSFVPSSLRNESVLYVINSSDLLKKSIEAINQSNSRLGFFITKDQGLSDQYGSHTAAYNPGLPKVLDQNGFLIPLSQGQYGIIMHEKYFSDPIFFAHTLAHELTHALDVRPNYGPNLIESAAKNTFFAATTEGLAYNFQALVIHELQLKGKEYQNLLLQERNGSNDPTKIAFYQKMEQLLIKPAGQQITMPQPTKDAYNYYSQQNSLQIKIDQIIPKSFANDSNFDSPVIKSSYAVGDYETSLPRLDAKGLAIIKANGTPDLLTYRDLWNQNVMQFYLPKEEYQTSRGFMQYYTKIESETNIHDIKGRIYKFIVNDKVLTKVLSAAIVDLVTVPYTVGPVMNPLPVATSYNPFMAPNSLSRSNMGKIELFGDGRVGFHPVGSLNISEDISPIFQGNMAFQVLVSSDIQATELYTLSSETDLSWSIDRKIEFQKYVLHTVQDGTLDKPLTESHIVLETLAKDSVQFISRMVNEIVISEDNIFTLDISSLNDKKFVFDFSIGINFTFKIKGVSAAEIEDILKYQGFSSGGVVVASADGDLSGMLGNIKPENVFFFIDGEKVEFLGSNHLIAHQPLGEQGEYVLEAIDHEFLEIDVGESAYSIYSNASMSFSGLRINSDYDDVMLRLEIEAQYGDLTPSAGLEGSFEAQGHKMIFQGFAGQVNAFLATLQYRNMAGKSDSITVSLGDLYGSQATPMTIAIHAEPAFKITLPSDQSVGKTSIISFAGSDIEAYVPSAVMRIVIQTDGEGVFLYDQLQDVVVTSLGNTLEIKGSLVAVKAALNTLYFDPLDTTTSVKVSFTAEAYDQATGVSSHSQTADHTYTVNLINGLNFDAFIDPSLPGSMYYGTAMMLSGIKLVSTIPNQILTGVLTAEGGLLAGAENTLYTDDATLTKISNTSYRLVGTAAQIQKSLGRLSWSPTSDQDTRFTWEVQNTQGHKDTAMSGSVDVLAQTGIYLTMPEDFYDRMGELNYLPGIKVSQTDPDEMITVVVKTNGNGMIYALGTSQVSVARSASMDQVTLQGKTEHVNAALDKIAYYGNNEQSSTPKTHSLTVEAINSQGVSTNSMNIDHTVNLYLHAFNSATLNASINPAAWGPLYLNAPMTFSGIDITGSLAGNMLEAIMKVNTGRLNAAYNSIWSDDADSTQLSPFEVKMVGNAAQIKLSLSRMSYVPTSLESPNFSFKVGNGVLTDTEMSPALPVLKTTLAIAGIEKTNTSDLLINTPYTGLYDFTLQQTDRFFNAKESYTATIQVELGSFVISSGPMGNVNHTFANVVQVNSTTWKLTGTLSQLDKSLDTMVYKSSLMGTDHLTFTVEDTHGGYAQMSKEIQTPFMYAHSSMALPSSMWYNTEIALGGIKISSYVPNTVLTAVMKSTSGLLKSVDNASFSDDATATKISDQEYQFTGTVAQLQASFNRLKFQSSSYTDPVFSLKLTDTQGHMHESQSGVLDVRASDMFFTMPAASVLNTNTLNAGGIYKPLYGSTFYQAADLVRAGDLVTAKIGFQTGQAIFNMRHTPLVEESNGYWTIKGTWQQVIYTMGDMLYKNTQGLTDQMSVEVSDTHGGYDLDVKTLAFSSTSLPSPNFSVSLFPTSLPVFYENYRQNFTGFDVESAVPNATLFAIFKVSEGTVFAAANTIWGDAAKSTQVSDQEVHMVGTAAQIEASSARIGFISSSSTLSTFSLTVHDYNGRFTTAEKEVAVMKSTIETSITKIHPDAIVYSNFSYQKPWAFTVQHPDFMNTNDPITVKISTQNDVVVAASGLDYAKVSTLDAHTWEVKGTLTQVQKSLNDMTYFSKQAGIEQITFETTDTHGAKDVDTVSVEKQNSTMAFMARDEGMVQGMTAVKDYHLWRVKMDYKIEDSFNTYFQAPGHADNKIKVFMHLDHGSFDYANNAADGMMYLESTLANVNAYLQAVHDYTPRQQADDVLRIWGQDAHGGTFSMVEIPIDVVQDNGDWNWIGMS